VAAEAGAVGPAAPPVTVTVVVPTHDRQPVLARTVASILGQRDVDVRLVVVDDRSTDGTWDWLSSLGDGRVRTLRSPGVGGAVARNAGIAVADTEWVAFCDDDDRWAPGKLAAQLDAMAASGARWSCTGAITVDADDRVLGHQRLASGGDVLEPLLHADVIPGGGSSVVAERSLVEGTGGFDESLATQHDWELWIRFAQRSPVASVDEPLVAYRVWPGSMSWDVGPMDRTYDEVVRRYAGRRDPAADLLFDQYLARMELRSGDRVGAARRHLRMAVRHRLPKQAVHAALALAVPALAERRRAAHELAQVPTDWLAAAAWVQEPVAAA
jgi:glycosyltransferase involved in cell wall biosynthesis